MHSDITDPDPDPNPDLDPNPTTVSAPTTPVASATDPTSAPVPLTNSRSRFERKVHFKFSLFNLLLTYHY